MSEQLHFHFSLSSIGEGNGNPLQCSCLENPRDGGAWWAAISGGAQSRTRLKRLSSSSNSSSIDTVQACELSLVNWLFLPVTLKWSQYNNETYSVLDSKDGSSIHGTCGIWAGGSSQNSPCCSHVSVTIPVVLIPLASSAFCPFLTFWQLGSFPALLTILHFMNYPLYCQ